MSSMMLGLKINVLISDSTLIKQAWATVESGISLEHSLPQQCRPLANHSATHNAVKHLIKTLQL